MISELELKAGPTPKESGFKIQTTPVTIFVGPNNSGKSQVLREIEQFCSNGRSFQNDVVLAGMTLFPIPAERVENEIAGITLQPNPGELLQGGQIVVGSRKGRSQVAREQLKTCMINPESHKPDFCTHFLRHTILKLDGPSRINLVNDLAVGDLLAKQHQPLGLLFNDETKRLEVRRIVHDAFGVHFVVDPTHSAHLRIRFSSRAPNTAVEEQALDAAARNSIPKPN
jgi:hypothetical protein